MSILIGKNVEIYLDTSFGTSGFIHKGKVKFILDNTYSDKFIMLDNGEYINTHHIALIKVVD